MSFGPDESATSASGTSGELKLKKVPRDYRDKGRGGLNLPEWNFLPSNISSDPRPTQRGGGRE